MKHQSETLPYNKAVREAHTLILKKAKQLLSTFERDELRYSLERGTNLIRPDFVVHEFVNPLLYLRLECNTNGLLCLHYGFEEVIDFPEYSKVTSAFVRFIYQQTSKETTAVNIEDCVQTSWLIRTCSDMYEYLEERNKYHTFKQIAYKPSSDKRKQMRIA